MVYGAEIVVMGTVGRWWGDMLVGLTGTSPASFAWQSGVTNLTIYWGPHIRYQLVDVSVPGRAYPPYE